MTRLHRSFLLLLPAALFLSAALPALEPQRENIFDKIGKSAGKAVSEASFQIREKMDFNADSRTRAAIGQANELRVMRAAAAGRFVNEHFTNKIVVPVFFNCQDDPLEEKELEAFMEQAMSVKMAGPVYITHPDALPLPDERPTAAQLNEALLRSMELRADAVVVFMGLPDRKKEKAKLVFHQWSENAPRLILTEVTDSFFLKRSMFPCPVAAAILPRTSPPEPESEPEPQESPWYDRLFSARETPPEPDPFDLRYVLLCDENADELTAKGIVFLSPEKKKGGDDLSLRPWLNWPDGGQKDFLHRPPRREFKPSVLFPDDIDQAYRDLFRRSGLPFVNTTTAVEETR